MKKRFAVILILALSLTATGCGNKSTKIDSDSAISVIEKEDEANDVITLEEALHAIEHRCLSENPSLEEMIGSDDYSIYWNAQTNEDGKIVVIYRSYTGAIVRYYIDPDSGDTYVTEFVQGITDDEEPTGETFNLKDYIKESAANKD
ncbi:MAG: hypothetical protein J6X08_01185 [Lachnospiraceae bacterium]|nr:hypothetical protein [Lachnospiraceae bacterium]